MFELNILRGRRQRLHICNRSAGRDWRTAVNSIQTWLGQIEGWMLPLFERGGGKAKGGIEGISAPLWADHRAWGGGGLDTPKALVPVGQSLEPEQMMFRIWRLLRVCCLLSLTIKMESAAVLTGLNSIASSRCIFSCEQHGGSAVCAPAASCIGSH